MTTHAPDSPVSADAPGRVNLLGEHTDYSEGYVLPTAIPQRTTVTLRRGGESGHSLRSAEIGQPVHFSLDAAPEEAFARYVYGCLVEARRSGIAIAPLDIEVRSEVPIGVGLSSSAALEVATLRALREFLAAPWDDVEIARMAQRAEIEHAGVRCGIMDQMAASLGDTESALFLDTRTLQSRRVALPQGTQVLVSIPAFPDPWPIAATTSGAASARRPPGSSVSGRCATPPPSRNSKACPNFCGVAHATS